MPLYEYRCQNCGKQFEVMQKFSDAPLTLHEECGGPVTKLLSAPALQFKGSGWYVTDYARSGSDKGSSGAANGSGNSESGKSSEGKPSAPATSDAKPASTSTSNTSDTK